MSEATLTIDNGASDNIVLYDTFSKYMQNFSIFRRITQEERLEHSSTSLYLQDNLILNEEIEESWNTLYNFLHENSRNETEEEEQIFEDYFSKFEVK